MRQAAGFSFAQKKAPIVGQAKICGMSGSGGTIAREDCIFEPLQHYAFPFGRVFLRSACFCEFKKKRICSMSEVPSTATADSDYPTKPEATKANAMTAPLGCSNRSCANLRQADLGCQLKRSLVQIWTLILTNYDTNLQLN
jgi:hypothetical protein